MKSASVELELGCLNVLCFLFTQGYRSWLPQSRREKKCFFDRGRAFMGILLLAVRASGRGISNCMRIIIRLVRLRLEIVRESLSIDKPVAGDDTNIDPLRQHVQQCCLQGVG